MLVTLDTSQLEMSSLKLCLSLNNRYMVVTCETFQSPISPYVLVTVVLLAPPAIQSLTAGLRVALVSGSLDGDGLLDGTSEGAPLGIKDGSPEGIELGANEGSTEGCDDGAEDGTNEGKLEGIVDGEALGIDDGSSLGD
jgi:hypothetical protein